MVNDHAEVAAIVQARMRSTRLPGKVMALISNKPMLQHIVERLQASCEVGTIIIATTTLEEDDVLDRFARQTGFPCYRGEEQDVLARYYGAAVKFNVEVIVRICSDDPLIDPRIIDRVVQRHLGSSADYTSTGVSRMFPLGLDVEVFDYQALARAYREARQEYEREHVTPYIYMHPEIFELQSVEAAGKLRRPDLRLTVDTEEDLKLIREIFSYLHRDGEVFDSEHVIDLLDENPNLVAINAHVKQKRLGE